MVEGPSGLCQSFANSLELQVQTVIAEFSPLGGPQHFRVQGLHVIDRWFSTLDSRSLIDYWGLRNGALRAVMSLQGVRPACRTRGRGWGLGVGWGTRSPFLGTKHYPTIFQGVVSVILVADLSKPRMDYHNKAPVVCSSRPPMNDLC